VRTQEDADYNRLLTVGRLKPGARVEVLMEREVPPDESQAAESAAARGPALEGSSFVQVRRDDISEMRSPR
jgi:hypothetical protein